MKITVRRFISILLAMLLAITCAGLLFACNKDKDKDARERDAKLRAENVAVLKDEILGAMDENWAGELDSQTLSKMNNAGDYIVASGWADMICDVLKNSALQTGKLTALKNAVLSEDGQKLLEDFEGNAELLIPLMRNADFTPTDISNVTYDLLCALVSESGNAVDAMQNRLSEVKGQAGISAVTVANIESCSLNLTVLKRDLVPTESEKTEMLNAFKSAKAPLGEIVEFAYNMSIGSITDNIFNALFSSDGALSNITNGEISTVITALINNASSLKDALDNTAIANLNKAIGLVIDKFDNESNTSTLYAEIVQYAKYAYMFVDVIPAMCDVMSSAGKVFDTALIEQLRGVAGADVGDNGQLVNSAIMSAKIVLQAKEDFTAQQLSDIIDKVGAQVNNEYQKALPFFALDIALNLSTWFKDIESTELIGKHPEIITKNDTEIMIATIMLTLNMDNAKQAYKNYKSGQGSASALLSAVTACNFDAFGIKNPYNQFSINEIDAWYNYYMVSGIEQANAKAVDVCNKVVRDLKEFVSDFYSAESQSRAIVEEIANWQFVTEELSEDKYAEYENKMLMSDLLGIISLISILLA